MHNRSYPYAVALGLAALFAGGVAMPADPPADPLDDTAWILESLPGRTLLPGVPVTLRFEEGRVSGSDGCNRYGAPYRTDGGFHLAGSMVTTQMACSAAAMEQAGAYAHALRRARAARIDGARLVLTDERESTLATFTAQPERLAGTSWRVTGYNNGRQAVVSPLAGTELTIVFGADGRVNGSSGCNRYTGTYEAQGRGVRFGPLASTKKACVEPKGVMEQESAFFAALRTATRVRVEGERLELRRGDRALAVVASATSEERPAPANVPGPGAATVPTAGGAAVAVGSRGLRLPATFRGDLRCADCEAIRHHLDLWPDQVFHLRRLWVGSDRTSNDIGQWRLDPARHVLVLQGGTEMPLQFEILGPDRLRLVDTVGHAGAAQGGNELASAGKLTPTDLTLNLGGELTYLADAARFTECLTGRSYPVALEGDFAALERAYLAAVKEPGAALYATFEGSIVDRPRMEGGGAERTVVVNRYINVWPEERCERARADASLSNTYWRIVRLGADPVSAAPGRREPHVILRLSDGAASYSATVGCNSLAGGYAVDGPVIRFSPAATTRTACPAPLDDWERRLGEVLQSASRWKITANTLELADAQGRPLALLVAVYL